MNVFEVKKKLQQEHQYEWFWTNISLMPFTQMLWTGVDESMPYVEGWLSNGKAALWGNVPSIALPSDIVATPLLEKKMEIWRLWDGRIM